VKRGGGLKTLVLDETLAPADRRSVELIALNDALDGLARLDQQQSRVVELRFFGGLSVEETAAVLQVSRATVNRDWVTARAWLLRELGGGPNSS
jgi:RNA polymerase sigma factor (TIGR02999 family)